MASVRLKFQIWDYVAIRLLQIEHQVDSLVVVHVSGLIGSEVWFVVRSQGRVSSTTQLCRRAKVLIYEQLSGGADV
jgi:hypothetical protein